MFAKNHPMEFEFGTLLRIILTVIFYGAPSTPNLTPNLGSFLPPKRSYFYSQSGVKITPKLGLFNSSISGVTFTPEKEFCKLLFGVKITPPKINSTVTS